MFSRALQFFRSSSSPHTISNNDRRFWEENGFVIIPALIPMKDIDAINDLVTSICIGNPLEDLSGITVDPLTGPLAGKRLRLEDAPPDLYGFATKINDLYLRSSIIREVALNSRLSRILKELLQGEPTICNSLNFLRGSNQPVHADTWYMPPPDEKRLVAVSICLEDVSPDAGPIFYYPGSHLIPPYRFSHGKIHAVADEMDLCNEYLAKEIAARGLKKETFLGRKGDVLIWHAQLLHGGDQTRDFIKTRRSLVVHYWPHDDLAPLSTKTLSEGRHYIDREPALLS